MPDSAFGGELVTTVVIGAGHSGLAASHFLSEHEVDHVVLERGEVANSWRNERWDSLRLLTPNWQARLPGRAYQGDDPDGYMSAAEVADLIAAYADWSGAPVKTGVDVTGLSRQGDEYHLTTSAGELRARSVVIASGAHNAPNIPGFAGAVPERVQQFTPLDYGSADKLPQGTVLVVGASATGAQLADEIVRSGRRVVLSVGEHVRLPRTYRGRDILWWMDASGVWDQRYDEVDDLNRARSLPSPQLIGGAPPRTLDLNALTDNGVELVGRWASVRDGRALFSGGLRNVLSLADLKLGRLLDGFDEWAASQGIEDSVDAPERPEATRVPDSARWEIDLAGDEISSIVWATGFRPDYSYIDLPVLDHKGRIRHEGGVVSDVEGLYVLGLPVLRKRNSSFIHGIEDDARAVIGELVHSVAGVAAGSAE